MPKLDHILESILEQAPVSMQILDRDGLTLRVNSAYLSLFGYTSRDQVEGVHNPRTNPGIREQGLDRYIERGYAGEVVRTPAAPFHSERVHGRELRATVIPVFDGDRKVSNLVIVHEDVTAISTSERAWMHRDRLMLGLQDAYHRIADRLRVNEVVDAVLDAGQDVLKSSKVAIWKAVDDEWTCVASRGLSDTYEAEVSRARARVPEMKRMAMALLANAEPHAYSLDEPNPVLAPYHDILTREGIRHVLAVPLSFGRLIMGSLSFYRSEVEGEFDATDLEAAHLLADQASIGLHNARLFEELSAMRDELEERVRANTEELRTAHLEALANEKLAAVGFLAREVAHGLRNPLNVVSLNAQYLKMRYAGTDEKTRSHFDAISRAVDEAASTITNLITLAGPANPELADISLNDVARHAVRERVEAGAAPIETQWAKDLPPVRGDWSQLLQAAKSLLTNAIASRRTAPVRVTTSREADRVLLTVGDDRPEMTPEEQENALGPFSATATQWTGLGLSVAKQIAGRHNGDVMLRVRDGLTWFCLALPTLCAEPTAQHTSE